MERIPIEGKFGQGKNGYGLGYVRARLAATAESWVRSVFLVMNLLALARVCRAFLRLMAATNGLIARAQGLQKALIGLFGRLSLWVIQNTAAESRPNQRAMPCSSLNMTF